MNPDTPAQPKVSRKRIHLASLTLIGGASFFIRIVYCIAHGTFGVTPDNYREYVIAGTALITRGIYICPLAGETANLMPSAWIPPLYVGVIAGAYSLFGVETNLSTIILQLINAGATSLAAVFIFLVVARLSNRRAAWIAAIATAAHPLLVGFTDVLWDTSLFIMATASVIWFSTWLSNRDVRARLFFAFGLILGITAILSPSLTIAYPLLVLRPAFVQHRRDFRKVLRATSAAVLGWMLAVSPWCIRDFVTFGRTIYVRTNFWHEVWLGTCPEADNARNTVFNERFAMRSTAERERLIKMGELAYLDDCKSLAIQSIKADPGRFVRLSADRFTDFWLGTILTHASSPGEWFPHARARAGTMILLSLELIVIVAGMYVAPGPRGLVLWLISIAMLSSLTYTVTHVELRYRAQFEPAVLMALGISVDALLRRFQSYANVQDAVVSA
ncbi:MAG: hypothetical protein HY287_10395 [Planctomycetes bacterium]|nr:hypothetical protein [Planctomycetota bacterium]MBI3834726.1 hypothetical protein [Planctomycetota bacterium]